MTLTMNIQLCPIPLQDLLRSHAPGATLLASMGQQAVLLKADAPALSVRT